MFRLRTVHSQRTSLGRWHSSRPWRALQPQQPLQLAAFASLITPEWEACLQNLNLMTDETL